MSFSATRETQVASLHVATITSPTSTATSSTDGTDRLTYVTPVGGLFRVTIYLANITVSDAATSDLLDGRLTFTDEIGAKSAVAIERGASQNSLNHKSSAASISWTGAFRATAGSTIQVAMLDTVTGAKTVGAYRMSIVVDRIGK